MDHLLSMEIKTKQIDYYMFYLVFRDYLNIISERELFFEN